MTNPLDAALAALRDEVRLAEEHLASLADAPEEDRLAAAGDTYVARVRVAEAERSNPRSASRHRADLFGGAVGPLVADE